MPTLPMAKYVSKSVTKKIAVDQRKRTIQSNTHTISTQNITVFNIREINDFKM